MRGLVVAFLLCALPLAFAHSIAGCYELKQGLRTSASSLQECMNSCGAASYVGAATTFGSYIDCYCLSGSEIETREKGTCALPCPAPDAADGATCGGLKAAVSSHLKEVTFMTVYVSEPQIEIFAREVEETTVTTSAPTTQPPTTATPTTVAPTTVAPTTESPTTQPVTTQAPSTEAVTTQAPSTQAATTQAPSTEAATTQAPTTQGPTTQPPSTSAVTTQPASSAAPTTQPASTAAPTTTTGTTTVVPTTRRPSSTSTVSTAVTTGATTTTTTGTVSTTTANTGSTASLAAASVSALKASLALNAHASSTSLSTLGQYSTTFSYDAASTCGVTWTLIFACLATILFAL